MIKNLILIIIIFSFSESFSQMKTGVGGPGTYSEFNVKDCFEGSSLSSNFKLEVFKPNYILKGQTLWRTINLSNKQNSLLFSSDNKCTQISLIEIIKFGLFEKKLNAFITENFNEAQKNVLSTKQLLSSMIIQYSSEVLSFDADGNEIKSISIEKRFLTAKDIVNYLVKEDWIINSYSGKLEKCIIAIAPLVRDRKTDKILPLFWLYYPEWQNMFNSFQAKNYLSDEKITFKDVFDKNYFSSQISKENNLFDRSVKSTNRGQDANLESEIIKEKIKNFESDLFQY